MLQLSYLREPIRSRRGKCRAWRDAHAGDKGGVERAVRAAQLAAVYVQVGESDRAIAVLQDLIARPVRLVISPALLRLDPMWDPLRADPRFVALTQQPPQVR